MPTIITQASTTREPIIRLERDEARVADAHRTAAPRPPMIAVTSTSVAVPTAPAASGDGRSASLCYHPRSRPALTSCRGAHDHPDPSTTRFAHLAKTPRTWTGARTPSGLKRVRQAARRHDVLGRAAPPRRRYVAKALTRRRHRRSRRQRSRRRPRSRRCQRLDRAAKAGAIHPNAAARRKSRLTRKVNAALGGAHVQTAARSTKQTGKAAAAKAAKARIAAGKSAKAKGAQTAAGKARAALSKTARAEAAAAKAAAEASAATATAAAKPRRRPPRQGDDQGQGRDEDRPRRRPRRPRRRRPPKPRQGHRQGRARRRRSPPPRSSRRRSRGPGRHDERPGIARGVVDVGRRPPAQADAATPAFGLPASVVAGRGFGRNVPYSAAPPRPPIVVSTTSGPARRELLLPVEGRERVGVGHAGRLQLRRRGPASR